MTTWYSHLDPRDTTAPNIASAMWAEDLIHDYEVRNRCTDNEDTRLTRVDGQVLSLTVIPDATPGMEYDICWTIFDEDGADANTIAEDGAPFTEALKFITEWAAGK